MTGVALAHAAAQLVGTSFRLNGRDPATGLDCVGLLHASLSAIGRRPVLPVGYGLRNDNIDQHLLCAQQCGLFAADGNAPGDVIVAWVHRLQAHLAIQGFGQNFFHAHAGLRKVVAGPIDPQWKIAYRWRLA